MRTVLITGASSGIGRATAEACAAAGWDVLAPPRADLDLTQPSTIAAYVGRLDRLDALVNCAGICGPNPTLEVSDPDDLRLCMEVNFFGTIAVSRLAMPLLRATRGSLVTVSSVRGVIGQPFNEAYSAAKFAVEGFLEGLAPVAHTVGVRVSVVQPAAVLDTSFVDNAPGPSPAEVLAAAGPYAPAFSAYRRWVATGAIESAQKSADVAAVILSTLDDPDPAFRVQTSSYAHAYVSHQLRDPSGRAVQAMTRSWVS